MKYWILLTFLFASILASTNSSTKKIISRSLLGVVGEYAGPLSEPKMKMVVKDWSKMKVFENYFPNSGALNLFQNLLTYEFIWEDPENLMKDLPQNMKDGLVSLMRHKDEMWADKVFDLLSDIHSSLIPYDLRRTSFVEQLVLAVAESVDVNRRNELGHTPLMLASGVDGKSVLRLLQRNAEIEAIDVNHFTALHHASYLGINSSCKVLLKNGADVNAFERNSSPLKEASRSELSNADVVLTLLENGASFTEPDNYGRTPLQAAEYYLDQNDERVKILRKAEENLIIKRQI